MLAVSLSTLAPGREGATPVLLDLFTSEGCSSCPPADRLLAVLGERQPFAEADLVVLSEHVDYWNHAGWRDPYTSKLFSDRQRQYTKHLRLEDVYTPEVVVDGAYEGVGSHAAAVQTNVTKATGSQIMAFLQAERSKRVYGVVQAQL